MAESQGKIVKAVTLAVVVIIATLTYGCSINGEPRLRLASYATATLGTNFIDANNLGRHSYGNFLVENNGIVYTCRGGHIDIAHLRIAADYVEYFNNKVRKHLMNNDSAFTFKLNVEPSTYFVELKYPGNWKTMSEKDKEKIINEVSLELSQYLTYTMVTWHEVLTWFDFKCIPFWSEFSSAFSWEDSYSNLLGTRLAATALQDTEHGFDEAMTILIRKELEKLKVQSCKVARDASEKMRNKWYTGYVLIDMRERNMDIGLDDGFVTPILVPGVCEDAEPQSYPVPTLAMLNKYGFVMDVEVEPKEWEKDRILKIVYPDGEGKRIRPSVHLPLIMDYIKKEGVKMGYTVMPLKH